MPLGVIFFIYESRPNVTVDAASLCVKSGNAVILRGGKEAKASNQALADLLIEASAGPACRATPCSLVDTTDREAVGHFLQSAMTRSIWPFPAADASLIERVTAEATMPVLKHFDGICHVYVDASADLKMAERIFVNSKCQRPGVCNAAESLLVHRDVARQIPAAGRQERSVRNRSSCAVASERGRLVPDARPATDDDFAPNIST